jgi:TraM recognition site of TraD and TraG
VRLRERSYRTVDTVDLLVAGARSGQPLVKLAGFMADPALARSVLPAGESDGVDIGAFLAGSGTLYLIAESEHDDSPVAPLFAAMAGEIHYVAAQTGQAMLGGRLDPPLLMALDEIVQTCPVPLPAWLADSGGKGIQLLPVAHGEAQLRTRWARTAPRSSWTPVTCLKFSASWRPPPSGGTAPAGRWRCHSVCARARR